MYKVIYMYVSLSVAPYVMAVYYYFFIFLDCNQKSSVSMATHFYNISIRPVVILAVSSFFNVKTSQFKNNKHKQKL